MDPLTTTEGAPVVAPNIAAAPVATKTTKPRKGKTKTKKGGNAPTIARRKVLAGKHKETGAPKLEVIGLTKNPRRGSFTLLDIFTANGETISLLTIKKRKNELMAAGKLVLDAEAAKRQHEGHGRPPQYFNFDLTKGTVAKPRNRKGKGKAKVKTAPVVAAEGEQAPIVEQPAPAEQPAPVEQAPAEPVVA